MVVLTLTFEKDTLKKKENKLTYKITAKERLNQGAAPFPRMSDTATPNAFYVSLLSGAAAGRLYFY